MLVSKKRGLSLIELVVTVALVGLMMGISLFAMKGGDTKVSTVGLAAAISDELRAARLLAISNGYPVAIGIPTNGGANEVANSIYRLEGWNTPRVTWSVGYGGDYPNLGFAAARWSPATGTFANGIAPPPLSKVTGFTIANWAPTAHQSDSLFVFTPDGSVLTNNLPALDGRYTIVIAQNPTIAGGTISAGQEACVVYLSAGGAIDYSKGTPGTTLSGGSSSPRAPVKARDNPPSGTANIQMSEIIVRPDANDPTGTNDAYCIPGQQITFEIYAYDPEGRELFTQWIQDTTLSSGREGNFTVPRAVDTALTSETERMEWIDTPPPTLNWLGSQGAPQGGCFRSRWTWTVPVTSTFGDVYQVTADVKDAKADAQIENRPPPVRLPGAPAGRLLVEILLNGRWQMLRMNPDGSGQQLLTPVGLEEIKPSASHDGSKVAFIQYDPANPNNRYVKVRSLTGGGEYVVAGPANFTSVSISPDGGWISYRNHGANELTIRPLGDPLPPVNPAFRKTQTWASNTRPEPLSRTGWSSDGRYALWGHETQIFATELSSGADSVVFTSTSYTTTKPPIRTVTEKLFAPTCFTPPGGGERIIFAFGNNDPVLAHIPYAFGQSGTVSNTTNAGFPSGGIDDGLPSISVNGNTLVLPRSSGGTDSAYVVRWDGTNFVPDASAQVIDQPIRSAVWLP